MIVYLGGDYRTWKAECPDCAWTHQSENRVATEVLANEHARDHPSTKDPEGPAP